MSAGTKDRGVARRSVFARCTDLDGLEWLRGRDLPPFAPHAHDTFSIGLVEEGCNAFRRGRARSIAEAGALCVVNPAEVHTGGDARTPWILSNFYPTEDALLRVASELSRPLRAPGAPRFVAPVVTDPIAVGLVRALFAALTSDDGVLRRETALVDALTHLLATHAEPRHTSPRIGREPVAVRRARELLEARVAEDVSLSALAEVAALSPWHLTRVFRASVGMPPHAYQKLLRLRLAKARIIAGERIAQAAVGCGFSDQAHLTRSFVRVFGVTPGQVARAGGAKNVQDGRRPGS